MSNPTISRIKHDLELISGDGGGSGMIDERLRHLEADVAVIKATMATKDNLHMLENSISTAHLSLIKWMVGTAVAVISVIGGLMIGIANILAKTLGQ